MKTFDRRETQSKLLHEINLLGNELFIGRSPTAEDLLNLATRYQGWSWKVVDECGDWAIDNYQTARTLVETLEEKSGDGISQLVVYRLTRAITDMTRALEVEMDKRVRLA